jgi:chromosome segregation ATPase
MLPVLVGFIILGGLEIKKLVLRIQRKKQEQEQEQAQELVKQKRELLDAALYRAQRAKYEWDRELAKIDREIDRTQKLFNEYMTQIPNLEEGIKASEKKQKELENIIEENKKLIKKEKTIVKELRSKHPFIDNIITNR